MSSTDPQEKTVLIVDDVEYSRQLLRNSILAVAANEEIKTTRFKIVNASNGQNTFTKIEAHKPDLIFLDIELPDMNGIEILKKIKSENPKVVVIMVSGQSTIANVKESL
ncbi:MAG: two-component system chemotaxis response regulator CheY, partial [Phenylobacterium sp.]